MADEKDRFGETMKLVERAKEDIYFAERERELIEKLRAQLREVKTVRTELDCPKCPGKLETFDFHNVTLDRCPRCHGVWMDTGEFEQIMRKLAGGPLGEWIEMLRTKK